MILHGEIHSVSWQFYRAFPASKVVAVHMSPLSPEAVKPEKFS